MEYEKEFINFHNKKLSSLKKEFIKQVEGDYNQPDDNEDLYKKYYGSLQGRSNELKELNSKHKYDSTTSLLGICRGYLTSKKYKFDRLKTIIEKDCYQLFKENSKYSQFESFTHFLEIFAEYEIIGSLQAIISNNRDLFFKYIDKKSISSFFKINYNGDLNTLEIPELKTDKSESNKIDILNVLDKNEKLILLNIIVFSFLPNEEDINKTEYFRALLLCSDVLDPNFFYKVNTSYTNFRYFRNGVSESNKQPFDKRIMINKIIKKIEHINDLKSIIKSLHNYKHNI